MGLIRDRLLAGAGRKLTGAGRIRRTVWAGAALEPEGTDTEYTATGNPAVFTTNIRRKLTSFEIPLLPVMSGSGTPSPQNIRPISGWSGVTIDANGSIILVTWETAAGEVYGGTVDLVSGEMTVEYGISHILTASNVASTFYTRSGGVRFQLKEATDGNNEYGEDKSSVIAATIMGVHPNGGSAATSIMPSVGVAAGNSAFWVVLPDTYGVTDLESAAAWLGENNFQFVYKLRTNQTYQLTPVEIMTVVGRNSVATATGGSNTIKYLKRG